jgi:hypothetical protein
LGSFALIVLFFTSSCSRKEEKRHVISDIKVVKSKDVGRSVQLLGRLGVPLGTVTRVKGKVVPPRSKYEKGKVIFRVDDVNGVTLAQPEYFELNPAYGSPDLAELQYATKIVCYESGSFRGIPTEAFEHMASVATVEFGFESFLIGPLEK